MSAMAMLVRLAWPPDIRALHSSTSKLSLRTFETHCSRQSSTLEHLWDTSTGYFRLFEGQMKLKMSRKGQSELKLSGNVNECKPLPEMPFTAALPTTTL